MARKNNTDFDQIQYIQEYNKENYEEIKLRVKKGNKYIIKECAKEVGQSVNEYINQAIEERIAKERRKE